MRIMFNSNLLNKVIRYFFLRTIIERTISNPVTKKVSEAGREDFYALPYSVPFSLRTEDQEILEAIFVPGSKTRAVVICSGGLKSHETHSFPIAKSYLDLGFNILVFNYRGFGNSTGEPTEEGLFKDAEAAYQFLVREKGFHPKEIIGHGYSLGGGVIAEIALRHGIPIVLDRKFTSFTSVIDNYMKKKKRLWLLRIFAKILINACIPLDTLSRLKNNHSEVFIFRGKKDLSMSIKNIHALMNVVNQHPDNFTFVEAPVGHFHDEGPLWLEGKNGCYEARKAWLNFLNV